MNRDDYQYMEIPVSRVHEPPLTIDELRLIVDTLGENGITEITNLSVRRTVDAYAVTLECPAMTRTRPNPSVGSAIVFEGMEESTREDHVRNMAIRCANAIKLQWEGKGI